MTVQPLTPGSLRKWGFFVLLLAALALCRYGGIQNHAATANANLAYPTLTELEAQRTLLASYGWEVSATPTCEQVTLPDQFTEEYDSYLRIQAECGFSLQDYAGKTVQRCTYQILNYPGEEPYVYADLLVLDGEVIGGDVRSSQMDGFMQSLLFPAA